jgi:tetratricopeptide (TPR) repeat protein
MTGVIWKSAFIAALFALHPLHVESVAWISERKDTLSAFFWMLNLCLYVYYTEKPAIKRYLLVLFSFLLALMSKPMVVTLPVVMILLDYWPLRRFESEKDNLTLWQLKEKMPFFILSAVLSVITLYNPNSSSLKLIPLSARIANAPIAFVTYLEKTFWPQDMAVFYPFLAHVLAWQAIGASLLIIIITVLVIVMVKRLPYLFVGWFWYAITIAPVIGIIQISVIAPYAMADRYHYLPSVGIAIMMAWEIPSLFPRENIRKKILSPAVIAFLTIMSILTWRQCGYWKNSFELFNHALQATKNNYLAHLNRGNAYDDLGHYQDAIQDYNEAIRLKPGYAEAYSNRGNASSKLGQYQLAIEDLNEAIRLKPYFAESYSIRGNIYNYLGQHRLAIEDYNQAIHLKPDYADAYSNRGNIYTILSKHQLAIEDFNEAIRLNPDFPEYYNNRGIAYSMQGNKELGCRDVKKACELGNCKILEAAKSKGNCR